MQKKNLRMHAAAVWHCMATTAIGAHSPSTHARRHSLTIPKFVSTVIVLLLTLLFSVNVQAQVRVTWQADDGGPDRPYFGTPGEACEYVGRKRFGYILQLPPYRFAWVSPSGYSSGLYTPGFDVSGPAIPNPENNYTVPGDPYLLCIYNGGVAYNMLINFMAIEDVDRYGQPPKSCAVTGNPIYPMTGAKKEVVKTGYWLGGRELTLTYDTLGRPNARLWYSNFHFNMSVTALPNGTTTIASTRESARPSTYRLVSATGGNASKCASALPAKTTSLSRAGSELLLKDEVRRTIESYTVDGQLTAVKDAFGNVLTPTFSDINTPTNIAPAPGYLLRLIDNAGRFVDFSYILPTGELAATGGLVKTISNNAGQTITVGYDAAWNLSTLTWPDSKVKTFVYEDPVNPWALTGIFDENSSRFSTWTYAPSGHALSSQHTGGVDRVTVVYPESISAFGERIIEEVRGNTLCRFHDHPGGMNSVDIKDAYGETITLTIDTSMGYAQLAGQTQPSGSGCSASNKASTFDAKGNIASQDNFQGERTCYQYDTSNRETLRVEGLANTVSCSSVTGAGVTLPTGARSIQTQWHPDWKTPTRVVAPGTITTSVYHGQPDPLNGNSIANCTTATAMPNGTQPLLVCKQVTQATLVNGALDSSVPNVVNQYTYDANGRVLTAKDSLNRTTTYAYYATTAFTGVDPNAVGYSVGDLQTITDPKGFVTTFNSYDKSGRVLQMTDPKGIVTAMTYTPRGWVKTVTVTPPGGTARLTTYTYDNVGQLTGVSNPDGTSIAYTYDAAHRLVGATDARGNSVTYTLDNVGNRIAEQLKDPGGVLQRSMSRSFDALNRVQQLQVQ